MIYRTDFLEAATCQLDSLKSRLQTTKTQITIPKLAALVYREEGVKGFYRGLWIPLMTISFVRESIPIFLLPIDLSATLRRRKLHNIFANKRTLY